jgi:1,4-alpha-glucan branching enzyme
MFQKKLLAGRKVEVTFRMPPLDDVVELYLCGDFNGWQINSVPLTLESDGTWVARLVLEAGKSYRFRYRDSQGRWLNDREADAYVPNDFGSEDSVVDLTMQEKKPSTPKAAKKTASSKAKPVKSKKTAGAKPPKTKK